MRRFGNKARACRSTASVSLSSLRPCSCKEPDGPTFASLIHATCTCDGETFAVASRRFASAHGRPSAGTHCAIACPPCAQSTIVTRADFSGEPSAICLKRENSCVAFDMLMATNPMMPSSAGSPVALSGRIFASCSSAARRCPSGGVFCPPP